MTEFRDLADPPINASVLFDAGGDDQFDRRAAEKERTPPASKAISITPAKTGPWSGANCLGIEKGFAADEENRQTILKLDEWGFPEVWSVMLGVAYDIENAEDMFWATTAELFIGSGGATQEVEVDWVEGTVIRCAMNALNCVARYDTAGFPLALVIPDDLRLRVTISRGPLSGGRAPTKTERVEGVVTGGAGTIQVKIPKFAKRLFVLGADTPADVYNAANVLALRVSENAATPSLATLAGTQFLSFPEGIPIPNGCRYVHFTNNSGNTIAFMSFVFELAL